MSNFDSYLYDLFMRAQKAGSEAARNDALRGFAHAHSDCAQ